MNDLIEDLKRRAKACRDLASECAEHGDEVSYTSAQSQALAYEHAAELVRRHADERSFIDRLLGLR